MFTSALITRLLLGEALDMHLRPKRTPLAIGVYAFSLVAQWCMVWAGRVDAFSAVLLTVLIVGGNATFYAALRSGFTRRYADPALTMPQMAFALTALAVAYRINVEAHGVVLMMVALVLTFGAFMLPPQRCRQLGWVAVVLLACAMAAGALRDGANLTL